MRIVECPPVILRPEFGHRHTTYNSIFGALGQSVIVAYRKSGPEKRINNIGYRIYWAGFDE